MSAIVEEPSDPDEPSVMESWRGWQGREHPWRNGGRDLTEDEWAELRLYKSQHRFKVAAEQRKAGLMEKIRRLQDEFEDTEQKCAAEMTYPFAHQLWDQGIERSRDLAIPPYTFKKFLDLPPELQIRIWSMGSRTEEFKVHSFVSMREERSYSDILDTSRYTLKGSSRVQNNSTLWRPGPIPTVLHVCRLSRLVARAVYTRLRYKGMRAGEAYFNTLYDYYYFGNEPWNKFKIFVDLMIKSNTTRPLDVIVQRDIKRLQRIRRLIVDVNIFGALPARIWAEFPKLEILEIIFYPVDTISDQEMPQEERPAVDPVFEKPHPSNKWGKRAKVILDDATACFQTLKNIMPSWKIPEIEVLCRVDPTGDSDYGPGEIEDSWEDMGEEELTENDDTVYLNQLKERLTHNIPVDLIRRLKHRHHPSRRIGIGEINRKRPDGKKYRDWITDSEAEMGGRQTDYSDSDDTDLETCRTELMMNGYLQFQSGAVAGIAVGTSLVGILLTTAFFLLLRHHEAVLAFKKEAEQAPVVRELKGLTYRNRKYWVSNFQEELLCDRYIEELKRRIEIFEGATTGFCFNSFLCIPENDVHGPCGPIQPDSFDISGALSRYFDGQLDLGIDHRIIQKLLWGAFGCSRLIGIQFLLNRICLSFFNFHLEVGTTMV
ncbi:hypothetical protein G7Y89_g15370 [Cudoniella acicularis]|uniref:2EXR domain-containing protein n=1 Tax=Cudoniella acicularis TaxID=354080 RepID=A0A8H4VLW8_9HELO|nr:hypothetical protein G7Y89_g15370 [Cudoniella acicularis]